MLANSVLPSLGGTSRPDNSDAMAGTRFERAVGVPHLVARVEIIRLSDGRNDLVRHRVDVGDEGNLRARTSIGEHRLFQGAETAAEGNLLLVSDLLMMEHQNRKIVEQPNNIGKIFLAHASSNIHAVDDSGEGLREPGIGDGHSIFLPLKRS